MELPGMLTILLCRLRADHQSPIGIGFQLRELIRLGVPLPRKRKSGSCQPKKKINRAEKKNRQDLPLVADCAHGIDPCICGQQYSPATASPSCAQPPPSANFSSPFYLCRFQPAANQQQGTRRALLFDSVSVALLFPPPLLQVIDLEPMADLSCLTSNTILPQSKYIFPS